MSTVGSAKEHFDDSKTMLDGALEMVKTGEWQFRYLLFSAVVRALWAIYRLLAAQGELEEPK